MLQKLVRARSRALTIGALACVLLVAGITAMGVDAASFATASSETISPGITGATATPGHESVTLSWNVTDEPHIARIVAKVGPKETTLPASARSYTFTGLPAGSYTFTVTAQLAGTVSASGTATADAPAPAEATATVPASPSGPTSPSGWSLAYGDGFARPIGNAAGQDNTWWPNRGGSVSTACRPGDNSNELQVYSSSQVSVTGEGLDLTAKHEANTCGSGHDYLSGTVRSTSTEASGYKLPKWKPTAGETFVFELYAKWPPSLGSGDPGWWSYDTPWTAELDMFEGWGWPSNVPSGDYFAGIPVWIYSTPSGSVRKESYSVLKDFGFDPTAAYHRYTTMLNGDGSLDEYIDGAHKWHVNAPAGEVHRPWMGLAIQYALRRPSAATYTTAPQFTSGSHSMSVRSAALYVDGAHAGQNIQNGGVAPGTTVH
jgi:hypothetical protein